MSPEMNTVAPKTLNVERAASLGTALVTAAALALLAGCDSEPDSHVVSAPPPQAPVVATTSTPVVVTTTQTNTPASVQTPAVNTVVVTQAPPAPQAEVVVAQPSPEYAWVAGYWTWRNSQYQWVAGHWEIPPRSNATWIPPHYEPEGSAFRFYEGYWN